MSAISGTVICALILGSAAAESTSGTATRMISQPTASSCLICSTVALTSRVSVEHMDWTAIGASPPILILPTLICLVLRRVMCMRFVLCWSLAALLVPVGTLQPGKRRALSLLGTRTALAGRRLGGADSGRHLRPESLGLLIDAI